MNTEFIRVEFDRKIAENPLNEHLRVEVVQATELEHLTVTEPAPKLEQEPEPYTPKPGDRYEIEGRLFVVVSVDKGWNNVKLRDAIFQSNIIALQNTLHHPVLR